MLLRTALPRRPCGQAAGTRIRSRCQHASTSELTAERVQKRQPRSATDTLAGGDLLPVSWSASLPVTSPSKTSPAAPSMVIVSPARKHATGVVPDLVVQYDQRFGAHDGREVPAAGDDRGMADQATPAGQVSGEDGHAVDVLRVGLVCGRISTIGSSASASAAASALSATAPLTRPRETPRPLASGAAVAVRRAAARTSSLARSTVKLDVAHVAAVSLQARSSSASGRW